MSEVNDTSEFDIKKLKKSNYLFTNYIRKKILALKDNKNKVDWALKEFEVSEKDVIRIIATIDLNKDESNLFDFAYLFYRELCEQEFINVFIIGDDGISKVFIKTELGENTDVNNYIPSKINKQRFYYCCLENSYIRLLFNKKEEIRVKVNKINVIRGFSHYIRLFGLPYDMVSSMFAKEISDEYVFDESNRDIFNDLFYSTTLTQDIDVLSNMYDEAIIIRFPNEKRIYLYYFNSKFKDRNKTVIDIVLRHYKLENCWFKHMFYGDNRESKEQKQQRIANEKKNKEALIAEKNQEKKEKEKIKKKWLQDNCPYSTHKSTVGGKSKPSTPSTGGKSKTATPTTGGSSTKKRPISDDENDEDDEDDEDVILRLAKKKK